MIETLTLATLCQAQSPLVLSPEDPVSLAVSVMGERHLSSVVILDGDTPVGLFTERDALGLIAAGTYSPATPLRALMSPALVTAPPEMSFIDGYARMVGHELRHLVLTDATGRLYGVLSETDFAHALGVAELQGPRTVADLMTREPATVPPGTSIAAALALMASRRISSVIVAEGGRALGILTERDAIRLATLALDLQTSPVAAVMSQPLQTIGPEEFAYEADPRMRAAGVRHLAVEDGTGRLVGVLSRRNLLRDIHDVHLRLLCRTITEQGQALRDTRQQLREQGLLRAMFEASPAGISLRDLDGRLVLVNPALLAMLGYQGDLPSIIGRHFSEFVMTTDQEQEAPMFAALLAGELPSYRLEEHYRHRDGHAVVAEVTVTAIRDATGTLTHALALVNDITELRLWAGAFEHCAHGLAIGDPQTNTIRACNRAFADVLGAAPDTIAGQPIASVYAPEDCGLLREHIPLADRTGRTRYESRMRRRDGSTFDVQMDLVSVFAPDGSVLYRVATMQDISARKQAQATLQESEERYRGIVNNVVDAIFILDLQGRFLAVNDQACRRYGYDRETFLTLHIRDIDMPDDAVNVPQRLALLQREGAASFEAVHQDAQGCPIPVEVRATKSLFDGKPCMLSVVRDISERKRAEAALAEREEQLRLFIEHAPVALAMLDHALRYVAASRRWLDDYVLGERDIVGRSHYEVFPNIRDSWKESNRRALAGEVIRSEEDRYERQDGTLYWLRWEVRPWRRSDGAVGGIVIFAEDITARKLAEQELERAHHVLAEAQRISHLGSFEYDAATQHTVWSDEEYRIYGLDPAGPSPVYEAMLAQCIHPDDAAQLHQSFSAALASRSVYELEHRIVRPDGSVRWVYDLAHPYYDADGELVRYIGTTLDITERKQAELELRRYQQIVETSSEMLIFLDRDLRYRVVNPAYATLRHSTPADLQGRLAREVVGAEDYANIGPHLESALTGQAQRFCGSITAADGKHRYLDSDVRPFRGHDGTVLGVVVSIHDVTEAREAQLALQDQQARLADLVAARTAELQASETKLRTIYDLLPIGIAVTDRAGQIIDCNRAAEVMLGIAREEHFRRTYDGEEWAIIRPDGTPMPSSEYASVRALRESRLVGEIEMGVQRPAGVIWLSVSAMPTQHPEYGVVVAFVDVTARKTVEQTIRRYEQIVRSSVDAIYSTTLDGRIDSWNPAAETIYGYRAEEMLGQPLARLLLPDAFDEAAEIIRRVAQGETLGAFEVQHRGKDGRAIEISLTVSPIRDAAGRVVGVAKVACDIGERKRAEAQLRRLTERLQLATEAGGIGVWEWDVVEDRLIWDEQMYALYGVREQDFSGAYAAWVQGLHPEDAAQAQAEIERALHGQQTFRPEFRVRWPDGTVRDIAAFGKVVRDAAGVPQRMVGVNWDITEAKQARALAEQATRLKSEFLVNMSHEIRTPMNAVLGFTYLLERRPLDPAARDLVLKVRNAGRSLLTLINDILDFSKIEAGRLELESAPFRLTGLLDDLAAIMTAAARDKPLELIITPHPVRGYDALIGDAGRLQQVLINLLGNAIKFTEQGEVELRIDLESAAESDVRLRFAVRDTGIGISADQQAQIFAPFRQADSSISRRFGGTGLGLAISRQLVALLGGELRVESVPGEGSEFWFVLPLRGDPAAASASAPPELAGLHLLVADDSATAGAALVNTAAALGWTADLVTSGAAALGLAQARLEQPGFYDALLLDWQMPGQDGLATAALIREALRERMEASREPPVVIMVTAYARDALLDEPGMAVVDALLSKPVTPSALYHAIGEALSRRRPGLGLGRGLALTLPTGAQTPRLAGVRLLVVDDSDINREVAQQILQEEGASVHLAEDGQEALDWLADHPHEVDIVLMDVQMPRLDGYAATRRIRADARWQELPVLALTAGAYKELREAALAAGMNDFIAKPIQVEEAIALIQHWTGHRSAPVATALAVDPAGETPTAAVSAIDVASALQQWRTLESYRTYLDTFVARYADAGLTIATLCQDGDRAAAAALAHKLVGVAGSLALPRVLDLTRQLDRRLKGEEPIAELTMALQTAIDEVCAGIKAGIGTGIDAGIDVGLAPEGPAAAPRVDPDPDPGSVDLRALLDQFLDALDQHDPDLCESLLAQLSGRMAAEPLAAVQSRLTEFDFLGAEALTRALRRDLNRST